MALLQLCIFYKIIILPKTEAKLEDFNSFAGLNSKVELAKSEIEIDTITNKSSEDKLKNYNPEIKLVYKNKNGDILTAKEEYKRLSQAYHGTKSNKRKLAKAKLKIQERNQKNVPELANIFL